jgi:hypothetical protein
LELIATIFLLVPRTVVYGAALSLGVISGALFLHLTRLGIALRAVDDHGELFALAVVVFICSAGVVIMHRHVFICSAGVLIMHRHELPVVHGPFRSFNEIQD